MRTAPSATLARHWVPERSLVSDAGLGWTKDLPRTFVAMVTGEIASYAIKLATAALVLPAGWRLSRSR